MTKIISVVRLTKFQTNKIVYRVQQLFWVDLDSDHNQILKRKKKKKKKIRRRRRDGGYDFLGDDQSLVAVRVRKLIDDDGGMGGDGREIS